MIDFVSFVDGAVAVAGLVGLRWGIARKRWNPSFRTDLAVLTGHLSALGYRVDLTRSRFDVAIKGQEKWLISVPMGDLDPRALYASLQEMPRASEHPSVARDCR